MSADIPADRLPRVGQLLRLLSSDRDGEALAAVRALARELKSANADFHDLADRLAEGPTPAARASSRAPANDDWRGAARWCASHGDGLNAREQQFIDDMAGKARRANTLTERQESWLWAIHDRLKRRRA